MRPKQSAFPTVGILGGGQLGRMTAAAALRLGVRARIYQTRDTGPAAAADVFTGSWDDEATLRRFADGCDVLTLDNEWVPLDTVLQVSSAPVRPSSATMARISNKVTQKIHARASGLPVGPYRACSTVEDALAAADALGYPVVVKRPSQSYDGYGNRTAHDRAELTHAFAELFDGVQVLVEQWVPFVSELAVIVARRPGGEDVCYPVATTIQREHKCHAVEVPAALPTDVTREASALAREAARAYEIVGAAGVEMFLLEDGTILLNEVAPRPHNTGHYTIDACVTSQFENHLRAILDLPLGDPSLLRPAAAMVNVLGRRRGTSTPATLSDALAVRGAAIHIYDKHEVWPGRKMGHVTAVADVPAEARRLADDAAARLEL